MSTGNISVCPALTQARTSENDTMVCTEACTHQGDWLQNMDLQNCYIATYELIAHQNCENRYCKADDSMDPVCPELDRIWIVQSACEVADHQRAPVNLEQVQYT